MESPYAAENKMSYWDERMTLEYIKKLNNIFRELQKLERDLLMLLKERRKVVQTGFDTLIMREDAANILGLCTRQFDRIVKSGQLRGYNTIYGVRFRMGDVIAFGQMRGEVNSVLILKRYNPWSKKMTDLDKVLGQIMNVDLSHAPMDIEMDEY